MTHPRAKIFFGLYLCAIVYLSLFPGDLNLHPRMGRLVWVPIVGRRQVLDFILNVLFYAPLGASGCMALRHGGLSWIFAVATGVCLSGTIEWLQLWTPTRFGNLTDLTSNTLGTVIGASAALIAARISRLPARTKSSPWALPAQAWLFLAAWLFWQMFPFVPSLSLPRLLELPRLLAPWSWLVVIQTSLGSAVLSTVLKRSPWVPIAFAALLTQAFLLNRALSPAALCGASLGWVTVQFIGARSAGLLAYLLHGWLIFEEFRPFAFAGQPSRFGWAPFISWYEVASIDYYPTIFGKLFLYLAAVWSLRHCGSAWIIAVGIPGVILASGEWTQRYLEGRTPESTDLLLLAAGAVLLKLTEVRVEDR